MPNAAAPCLPAVLRNMSNGYKYQQHEVEEAEPASAPKRRRTPTAAGHSPAADGSAPARRASDHAEGGGDERSVVELETDADGMDDGYRCVGVAVARAARAAVPPRLHSSRQDLHHAVLAVVLLCRAGGGSTGRR